MRRRREPYCPCGENARIRPSYGREHFGKLYDLIFSDDLNAAQVVIATRCSFRFAETSAGDLRGVTPDFVTYASCFLAMLMGRYLLQDLGIDLSQLNHLKFSPAKSKWDQNEETYFTRAVDAVDRAVEKFIRRTGSVFAATGSDVPTWGPPRRAERRIGGKWLISFSRGSSRPSVTQRSITLMSRWLPAAFSGLMGIASESSSRRGCRPNSPEMFVLGDYDVERKTGPAIWLRCVIANKAPNVELPNGATLSVSTRGRRQSTRGRKLSGPLKPLAELQYSGVIWSQINSKDWTILAFLKSDQGGLGLDAPRIAMPSRPCNWPSIACWMRTSNF